MSDTPPPESNPPRNVAMSGSATGAHGGGPSWLLAPGDLPPGVQLTLTTVLEETELRPEVLQALAQVAQEIQRSPAAALPQAKCGPLTSCDNMTGDCGRLRHCGTYRVGPSPL
jgi:hypothetical protein